MRAPLGSRAAVLGAFGISHAAALGGRPRSLRRLMTLQEALFMAGEAGDAFDPNDLTRQFQDSAFSQPVTAVGQAVGSIWGKAGQVQLFQPTPTSRPTLQRDANGAYYWLFDGVDDSWSSVNQVDFTGTDKVTLWAGVTKTSDLQGSFVCELSTNAPANVGTFGLDLNGATVNGPRIGAFLHGSLSAGTDAPPDFASPVSAVISAQFDIEPNTLAEEIVVRRNGVKQSLDLVLGTTAGTGAFGKYTLYVGRRAGTQFAMAGRIYGLIIRGAKTREGLLTLHERSIAARMGIAL